MPSLDIALLLYPGCMPAGLFAAADLVIATALRSGARDWKAHWVGVKPGAVACAHGVRLQAEAALEDGRWSAVLLPGFWASSAAQLAEGVAQQQPLVRALQRLGPRVPVWTWCTGVALAAAAGRLDGARATGTWWMAPSLEARHPRVQWQWQESVVVDRLASTASGVHGHLAILAQQLRQRTSAEAWRDVERLLVVPRPQPAPTVFERMLARAGSDPLLARLRHLVQRLPAAEVTIERLADALACSPRTLARRVTAAAGMPAGTYARLVKLHQAGEHLLLGERSVAQVSAALGFAEEAGFRRSFRTAVGMTPTEYRERYRVS